MGTCTQPHKTNHVDIVTIFVENCDCFLSGRFGTCVLYCTFTVVPTNIGKYDVSVKQSTVSILPYWFSVLDSVFYYYYYWYMIDPSCLACVLFCFNLYQIWGVISPFGFHKYVAANLNVPS